MEPLRPLLLGIDNQGGLTIEKYNSNITSYQGTAN
jgi:hypothetical protein